MVFPGFGEHVLIWLFVQSPQLGLKTNPPPIQEKPAKSIKKAPPTKEELRKMTVSFSHPVCFLHAQHTVCQLQLHLTVLFLL